MYILQTYVMIPSNIAYFILGVISTIIILIFLAIIAVKQQEKEKKEIADMFVKELTNNIKEKDKK